MDLTQQNKDPSDLAVKLEHRKLATNSKAAKAPTIKSTKAPTIKSTKAPTIKSTKAPVTPKSRRRDLQSKLG